MVLILCSRNALVIAALILSAAYNDKVPPSFSTSLDKEHGRKNNQSLQS